MIVRTEHSDYLIEDGTITRLPRTEEANTLRGDGGAVELLDIIWLEVGQPAAFLIQLAGVDVPTVRRTTTVQEINV